MKFNRLLELEKYLSTHHSATNEELCTHFSISLQTLRRDLKELEEQGLITKVYGGVVLNASSIHSQKSIPAISERLHLHQQEKEHIGQLAANLVENNDVIFIDSGTTACQMIPYLKDKNVTIISHSLDVLLSARDYDNLEVIALGGKYNREVNTYQADTSQYNYNYSKAFIATVGISIQKGLTNTDVQEGKIKQNIILNSAQTYVVCDSSKFDEVAFHHFSDFDSIAGIISEKEPSETYMKFFKNQKIKVIN